VTAVTATWTAIDGSLRSPLLSSRGVIAGFTTREDGSMAGSVYPLEDQARNRDALARRLGFDGVVRLKQVHGNTVVRMDAPRDPWPAADAMWTDRPNVLLGIAAADCVPVLVADGRGRIGGAHAGWQGTMRGVVGALLGALVGNGAHARTIAATLGPSIGPCCYVIDETRAELLRPRFAEHLRQTGERIALDLWSANVAQLEAAGVREIEVAGICTLCGGADLWSYRGRDADGRYGTQLGFIGRLE
jgi:YfiH family protein